jgi:beta-ketoacyl synthase-like protein
VKVVRFDPAPVFAGFGVLTPAGVGAGHLLARRGGTGPVPGRRPQPQRPMETEIAVDLPALCGETPLRFRRMDRFGVLGHAAAHLALSGIPAPSRPVPRAADPAPSVAEADPGWGVMIGSSLACLASIARHARGLADRPLADLSPSVFVRTVANAVNGDLSIGWGLGGPSETFVTGWTAGAEAFLAAAMALQEGRAEWILAGAVEAPDPPSGPARSDPILVEGAAIAVLGRGSGSPAPGTLRLRACLRGHDPHQRFSLRAALDAIGPIPIGTVIVANTIPTDLLRRLEGEAGGRQVLHLPRLAGELGAAGAAVATALAGEMQECALVFARDPAGGTAALALGR